MYFLVKFVYYNMKEYKNSLLNFDVSLAIAFVH